MWTRILISLSIVRLIITTLRNNRSNLTKKSYIQIQIEIFFRLPTKAHILQVRIICWKHDIGLTSSKDMKGPKKQGERNWVKTHFFLCLHEAFFSQPTFCLLATYSDSLFTFKLNP